MLRPISFRDGDEFTLHFDRRRNRLTGYSTDSPRFATADGLRVGEVSIGMLARRSGERIAHTRIGSGTLLLSPAAGHLLCARVHVLGLLGAERDLAAGATRRRASSV